MNNHRISSLGLAMLLALVAAAFSGCSSTKPATWNLNVSYVDPGSVVLDVVGIPPLRKHYWEGINVDEYWKEDSQIRNDVKDRRVSCNLKSGAAWELKRDDPIWQTWFNYGTRELMVIAQLPVSSANKGAEDGRRIFVPLNKGFWKAKNHTLDIEVRDEFVQVMTPPE